MRTPFEELEYLADFLPDEGESVVITRRHGELVCEAYPRETPTPKGLDDPEFFGRLVQANEQLRALAWLPLGCGMLAAFWGMLVFHLVTGFGWSMWYCDVAIAMLVGAGALLIVRTRREAFFHNVIRPMLAWQMRRCRIEKYALLGEVRRRPELKALWSELWRWTD